MCSFMYICYYLDFREGQDFQKVTEGVYVIPDGGNMYVFL